MELRMRNTPVEAGLNEDASPGSCPGLRSKINPDIDFHLPRKLMPTHEQGYEINHQSNQKTTLHEG
jgi:hypothetical protein